jgi:hypothetical protein
MKLDCCYIANLSIYHHHCCSVQSPHSYPQGAGFGIEPGVYLEAGSRADNLATLQPYVRQAYPPRLIFHIYFVTGP